MKRVLFALPLFLTLFLCLTSNGVSQTSSGTINGTVEDPSKAAVNGAEVVLTNEDTGVAVSTKTEHKGEFIFPGLQPGMFTVTVHAPGFKELKTIHLTLDASHNLSAGTVMLQVGAPSQEVTVTAGPTPLQNSSSERSGVLDNTQIENLLSVGRDVMSLLRVMPGNVGGSNSASLGTGDTPTVNGVRSEYNNATVDGVTGNTAGNSTLDTPLNLDAIQEVTVLQSNYQAEYGKTAGANINLVTKSGTQNFHGSLYYYNRNEAFNANSYFNKFNGQTRPQYRYNTAGGTLGGPIFWPRKFNSNRNKLFFFLSIENDPNRTPEGLHNYTVPTVLERMGDFSQSYNQGTATHSASALIRIKNPNSTGACVVNSATPGPGCFPGNKIPNVSSSQQALMNIFPLPNFSNLAVSSGNYNFVTNSTADTSVNQEVIRVDYAVSEKLHVFFRGQWETINDNGLNSSINPAPWVWRINFRVKTPNLVANTTYAFSPTLMNEFNIGMAYRIPRQIYNDADLAKFTLNPNGYNINALNPAGNPLNLLPKLTFGGVKNAATLAWGSRFPVDRDYVHAFSAADNLTKIIGAHALKFGVNAGTDSFLQSENAGMGAFAYARDTSNPLDSNYAYSNTLLGNFDTYSEPTHQPIYRPRTITFEWYTQDQWKVNKRLTLDYGMRYSWDIPQHLAFGSNFVPALYDRGQAPVLYRPTANKQAVDPTTGTATYPAAYAGLYVPNTGNPANGMLSVNTPGYPQGAVYGSGVLFAPRFGFAFDPYGEGKTVIRGGYGIFYNVRPRSGESGNMFPNPPGEYKPTQYYGNVDTFQNAAGLLGPSSIAGSIELHPKAVSTMSTSIGIQQLLWAGFRLDAAYVGTFGRHLSDQRDINEVPYGAEFALQNQSPAGGVLADNFFRPYPGYGAIPTYFFDLTSSYNALQVRLDRRFSKGLGVGVSYTWSKAMDYADAFDGAMPTYQNIRTWSYGPAGWDQRNNLTVNYVWSLPHGSSMWSNRATRLVLDNWQISGIASHVSGFPDSISFTTSNGANITGGGDGARVVLTGDPIMGAPHTFKQWFNTSVVSVPIAGKAATAKTAAVQGQRGNAPKVNFFDPAVTNFDTALFKNFPIHERTSVQFRLETYNTFNHSEFNAVNTGAVFANASSSATLQTSPTFGQLSGTAAPRYLQLALRVNF